MANFQNRDGWTAVLNALLVILVITPFYLYFFALITSFENHASWFWSFPMLHSIHSLAATADVLLSVIKADRKHTKEMDLHFARLQ